MNSREGESFCSSCVRNVLLWWKIFGLFQKFFSQQCDVPLSTVGEEEPFKGGEIAPSRGKLQSLLRGAGSRNHSVGEAEKAGRNSHHGAQGLLFQESLRNCWEDQEGHMPWGWETGGRAVQEQQDKPVFATIPCGGWGLPWKQGDEQGVKAVTKSLLFLFCLFLSRYSFCHLKVHHPSLYSTTSLPFEV